MDGVVLAANVPNIRRHHASRRVLAFVIPISFIVVAALYAAQPQPTFANRAADAMLPVTSAAEFAFRIPVARTVSVSVQPSLDGEVQYRAPLVGDRLYRQVAYVPSQSWEPGTTYTVTLSDVASAIPGFRRSQEYTFSFTAAPAPQVTSFAPDAGQEVLADSAFRVQLDRPAEASSVFSFVLDPALPLTSTRSADGTSYVITPEQLLPQGTTVTLHVLRADHRLDVETQEILEQGQPQLVASQQWKVRNAAGVVAVQPQGVNQSLTAPIVLTLSEATSLEQFTNAVSVTPPVVGEWATTDSTTFTLSHQALEQYTTYTVALAKTLRTNAGGFLPDAVKSQFRTIGPVRLASSSPAHAATGVNVRNPLRFTFDQPVRTSETVKHFRITPSVRGTFSWKGDTVQFTPTQALAFDTTYTVTWTKGIPGLAGYASAAESTIRFTTEHAVTRLAVPFHRQEHALSCEIATLVMALRYRGVSIGEQTIIDAIGFDPTPKKNGIWGDPDVAFVGDIDGQQPGTGYGVNAAPIAKAGSAYRTTRAFTNGKLQDVLEEVKAGNPVIVWGNAASGRRVDWKTPTGKTVRAIVGEHTRVVIGFTGSASNPVTIITLDPLYGEKRFTKNAFLADWALLGNMGVVVQ